MSRSTELENWTEFQLDPSLAEALVANNFKKPTEVQGRSLVHLKQHIDLVIAAKTGQGKTLCFGLPILDLLMQKINKAEAKEESESEGSSSEENKPKKKKQVFDSVKALILSPTRELALQIRDMIQAVIPIENQDQIKTCCLVGGMSIQKQQRQLSYNPAIVIATPGRLWELMDDYMEPYLVNGLPMIDILVLDEADRMIADGHFKEMNMILDHIYTKRVQFKREALERQKSAKNPGKKTGKVGMDIAKEKILSSKDILKDKSGNFKVG